MPFLGASTLELFGKHTHTHTHTHTQPCSVDEVSLDPLHLSKVFLKFGTVQSQELLFSWVIVFVEVRNVFVPSTGGKSQERR